MGTRFKQQEKNNVKEMQKPGMPHVDEAMENAFEETDFRFTFAP